MRTLVILSISASALAAPLEDFATKYPPASQSLAALVKQMPAGASNFGKWAEKNPDEAQKLAEFLKKPGRAAKTVEDPMEQAADQLGLSSLSMIWARQMTFPVFSRAFYDWAKKNPPACFDLLTTPGLARAALPEFDEMHAPPPKSAAEAVDQVFGNLEKSGERDRYDKADEWKPMGPLPKAAVSDELHKIFLEVARDYFTKYPYHRNEDNARNQVLAVIVTSKSWVDQGTDISRKYTGSDGLEHPMHRRYLGGLVVVQHDDTHCIVVPDGLIEWRAEDPQWGGPEYVLSADEKTRKIECAKIRRE
jgi:hypothetical protein